MFCWNSSRLGADPPPSMSPERNSFYESAFTYNTERQFRNSYSPYAGPAECGIIGESDEDAPTLSKILELLFLVLSTILVIFTLPFSLFYSIKFIGPYERLVITRLGHSRGVKGPGTVFVFPLIDNATRIDIRVQSFELPAFQVVTTDRGLVEVGIVVFSRVVDPLVAHLGLQNREQTLRSLSYNITYNNLVKRTLADLTDPEALARIFDKAKDEFNHFCQTMGLEVTQIAVRQLRVVKAAENQAVSLFNTIMKSELGEQLMRGLAPAIKAYMEESSASDKPHDDHDNDDGPDDRSNSGEQEDHAMETSPTDANLVFSLSPLLMSNDKTKLVNDNSDGSTPADCERQKMPSADADDDDQHVADPDIGELIARVRACFDAQLTSKINQRYLIHVLYDEGVGNEVEDVFENSEVSHDQKIKPHSDCMGTLDLDLRMDSASNGVGSCRWHNGGLEMPPTECVRFALRKATLLALVEGTVSPFRAYLNDAVKILAGTINDAILLQFLAERASVPKWS